MNLERSSPCSGWSRWNLTPIPPCVDHIDSAMLERETVLEWIWIDRKKICFGVIGLSQYMKAPPGLTSLIRALTVSCGVFMVTGQLTVILGCWRFSLDIECLAAQTLRWAIFGVWTASRLRRQKGFVNRKKVWFSLLLMGNQGDSGSLNPHFAPQKPCTQCGSYSSKGKSVQYVSWSFLYFNSLSILSLEVECPSKN